MEHTAGYWDKKIKKAIIKESSYNKITPSEDFSEDEYLVFLEVASPQELECDFLSKETYGKIKPDEVKLTFRYFETDVSELPN